MDALYRDYILDHYKNPRNFGTLEPHDLECARPQPALRRRAGRAHRGGRRARSPTCASTARAARSRRPRPRSRQRGADRDEGRTRWATLRRRLGDRPARASTSPPPAASARCCSLEGHARRHDRRRLLAQRRRDVACSAAGECGLDRDEPPLSLVIHFLTRNS